MNKQKRQILQCRVKLVKKLAKQLRDPKDPKSSWNKEQAKFMTAFYKNNACLPSKAKNVILKMSNCNLNRLLFKLVKGTGSYETLDGFCFEEKAMMCCFVSGKNWKQFWQNLNDFYTQNPTFEN